MTTLHRRLAKVSNVSLSIPLIVEELANINTELEFTRDIERRNYLFACYQALQWALSPDGYAPPSQCV